MKPYRKPDLHAPRYRPKKLNLTNKDLYNLFIETNPKYAGVLTITQFKDIIKTYNGKMWQTVFDERDGIELPEQLGYIFLGSCPKKKGENTNYSRSGEYGVKLQNQNFESDQYIAKIFYTNFETKYHFKNHELWGFTGVRDFKRTVCKRYPEEWKKYILVDNYMKVSRLFRKETHRVKVFESEAELLKLYDEFNLM